MGMFCFMVISGAAACLLLLGMKRLITVSDQWWKKTALWGSCWLLTGMIIYLGDWGNILPTVLFFMVVIWFTCEGSVWKKAAIGLMYASTILAFNALRDNFILTGDFRWRYRGVCLILEGALSLLLALFLYLVTGKYAPDREYHLSDSLWKLLLLLTATPFGIVLSLVLLTTPEERKWRSVAGGFEYNNFVLLLLALLSFISLLRAVVVLARQQQLEQQSMLAKINSSYYESMEQQHFAIRRLKHDLANHLAVTVALPEERREAYIKSLMGDGALCRLLQYCGDPVVNAVLTVKEEQMKRFSVRLETQIDISQELPFEKTDICALFSNALDNAAEACRRLPEECRHVCVKSRAKKGLFCLEVTNPVDGAEQSVQESRGKVKIYDGEERISDRDMEGRNRGKGRECLPPTTKADKENHGFGLRSMQEIVERGGGAMEIKVTAQRFEVFLYMPLG